MPAKKDSGTTRYRVLRDCAAGAAGDVVDLADADAALLIRDGMLTPEEG